jgi:hypothetical protein
MDFTAILTAIGPSLVSLLANTASSFKTTTAPSTAPANPPSGTVPVPDAALKDLQTLLNAALKLNPPLKVDGWLGPKTDAAIEQAIAMLKAAGIG